LNSNIWGEGKVRGAIFEKKETKSEKGRIPVRQDYGIKTGSTPLGKNGSKI